MSRVKLTSFLKKSQEVLEALWQCDVMIGGVVYVASRVGDRRSGALTDGGFVSDVDLTFKLRKELYPDMPLEGVRVKIRDVAENAASHGGSQEWVDYRIERVFGGLEPTWTVGCMSPDE